MRTYQSQRWMLELQNNEERRRSSNAIKEKVGECYHKD